MNIKSIIESLLFVNDNPVSTRDLAEVLNLEKKEVEEKVKELQEDYKRNERGMSIISVAGGYQMCSNPANEEWIKKMYRQKNKQRLSSAALECLAIIAYKQPITKMEIEAIRGVNVDGVMRNLTKAGLIKITGKKDVLGRPFLYGTTRKFLEYFGLNSLKDLPQLEEEAVDVFKETQEENR